MSASVWPALIAGRLEEVAAAGRWRAPRSFDAVGPAGMLEVPGGGARRPVVSFASNDYLGLSAHPAVVAAARRALERWGAGAGASRLVTGSRPVHRELEAALAEWKGTERAVCFPTGYAANLGVLSVLGGLERSGGSGGSGGSGARGGRILSDELNHASIVDGCRLARARVQVYRHADPDHAAALLSAEPGGPPAIVVTDAVFSMDGDVAPLAELADVCRQHGALLVVDEAHSVLGPALGPEVTEDLPVVRVGTLSKMLGSLGGFVAGPRPVVELLENLARPFIYSTALLPAAGAAALAALEVIRSSEGDDLRRRLAGHVARVRAALEGSGPGRPGISGGPTEPVAPSVPSAPAPAGPAAAPAVPGAAATAPTPATARAVPVVPIVPVVLGSEERALGASAALLDQGLWVPAIRPPTVPRGTSRLRVTLSAGHTDDQVGRLVTALRSLVGAGSAVAGPPAPTGPRITAAPSGESDSAAAGADR